MKRRGFLAGVAALLTMRSRKPKLEKMLIYPTPYLGLDPADPGGDTTVWWRAVMVEPDWKVFDVVQHARDAIVQVTAIPPDLLRGTEQWRTSVRYASGDVMCYESPLLRTMEKQRGVCEGPIGQPWRPAEQDETPDRVRAGGAGSLALSDHPPEVLAEVERSEGVDHGGQLDPEPCLRQARPGNRA